MPAVGDYVIITDNKVVIEEPGAQNYYRRNFELPIDTVTTQRGILAWMVHVKGPNDLKYEMQINGTTIATYTHDVERFGTLHEVVNANTLINGENRFQVVVTGGSGKLGFSDVVLHFQHSV